MKNECSIVLDLLPLYVEGMVSEDTAAFMEEHLEHCPACAAEHSAMKEGKSEGEEREKEQEEQAAQALVKVKKKLRHRTLKIAAVTAACAAALMVLLHFFPLYRLLQVRGVSSYYSSGEIAQLLYIGSSADRTAAQAVLRQADEAFHDCRHTREENEEAYGPLARYATPANRGASFVNHSLELWSAYLDDSEGTLWVCYTYEAFDSEGNIVAGSRKVPSLWKVQKNEKGEWVVESIKEHP